MNWDEIKAAVENNGNVWTFTVEQLRDAHGSGRTGPLVLRDISRTLAGMGLGHVPNTLPTYQHEQVRLYKLGTPVGDLITKVLTPGEQNDRNLRERLANVGTNYAEIVQQIREIVAEVE